MTVAALRNFFLDRWCNTGVKKLRSRIRVPLLAAGMAAGALQCLHAQQGNLCEFVDLAVRAMLGGVGASPRGRRGMNNAMDGAGAAAAMASLACSTRMPWWKWACRPGLRGNSPSTQRWRRLVRRDRVRPCARRCCWPCNCRMPKAVPVWTCCGASTHACRGRADAGVLQRRAAVLREQAAPDLPGRGAARAARAAARTPQGQGQGLGLARSQVQLLELLLRLVGLDKQAIAQGTGLTLGSSRAACPRSVRAAMRVGVPSCLAAPDGRVGAPPPLSPFARA
jgi:hypothetical protein